MLYTMPEIDNRISFGNVLTLFVLMVSGVLAFSTVQGQTNLHAEQLRDHEARMRLVESSLAGTLARIEQRLTAIEKATNP